MEGGRDGGRDGKGYRYVQREGRGSCVRLRVRIGLVVGFSSLCFFLAVVYRSERIGRLLQYRLIV